MKRLFSVYLDDILILTGIILIIIAATILSVVAGLFAAGAALITLGVLIGFGGERVQL